MLHGAEEAAGGYETLLAGTSPCAQEVAVPARPIVEAQSGGKDVESHFSVLRTQPKRLKTADFFHATLLQQTAAESILERNMAQNPSVPTKYREILEE